MNSNHKKNWNNFDPHRRRQNDIGSESAILIFTVANGIAIDLIIKNPIGSSIVHSRVSFTTRI